MKAKTKWELNKLFGYSGINDPRIQKDIEKGEREIARFAKKWRKNTKWLSDPKILKDALDEWEKPSAFNKPLSYLGYNESLDETNQKLKALSTRYSERASRAGEQVMFFTLELGKVNKEQQKKFLSAPELVKYRYFLRRLFETAKHRLTEPEEIILSKTSITRGMLYQQSLDKALAKQGVEWKGKELSLGEANNRLPDLPTKERRELATKVYSIYDHTGDIAETTYNAVIHNRRISDELRGYKTSYEATLISNDNTQTEIDILIQSISDNFKISHDFYKEKKRLLELDHLEYADRAAKVDEIQTTFSFDESVAILREAFGGFGQRYLETLNTMLERGQIDVYPKKGKQAGAYCSSLPDQATLVLLNHVNTFDSLKTFAHEMGHAVHAELAKVQDYIYEDHSLAVAETASTFFEQVVFDYVFPRLSEEDKKIALHNKLNDSIATIFRQTSFFNFEKEVHELVRRNGLLSHEEFKTIFNKHMKSYLGSAFKLRDVDGAFYVAVVSSHFSRPYYVYSYVFGELIAFALFEQYQNNPHKGEEAVRRFMQAGSSASPKDIFKASGVQINEKLWQAGLDKLKHDLSELKKLYK